MTSVSPGSGSIPSGVSPDSRPADSTAPRSDGATPTPHITVRDAAGDAAALARTTGAPAEAPGTGMSEGPRLELQQWASRLSDLTRELEALPPGSPEANARLAAIRSHLGGLSAIHGRMEGNLRSAPAALAQDYLLLLGSSRNALTFLNGHRSDPGSEAYQAEATLIGELQSRRDRSVASLRTLATDRMIPSLRVSEGEEPSPQQVNDYRAVQQVNAVLFEVTNEALTLPRGTAEPYANFIHPDASSTGAEMPDWMRSTFFRELNPHPTVTGTPPPEGSPDAEFPEGHPLRDLYIQLYSNRGTSMLSTDYNRAIQQLQGLRNELGEGGRYGSYLSSTARFGLNSSLERLEGLLREEPHRLDESEFYAIRRDFHRLGALDYRAQLTGAHATSARGRIDVFFRLYQEYGRLGDREAQRGCLYDIYQISQMGDLPQNRTNGLSEADRRAILLRVAEAYVGTGQLDANFGSISNALGREVTRLWNQGTEDSRFTALSLFTQYGRLYRDIGNRYTEGSANALGMATPRSLLGITTETGLDPILNEMEGQARLSSDPSRGAARLITLAQTYAMLGDRGSCSAILRSVEDSFAAHPSAGGNAFAARYLILSSFSNAGLADVLGEQVDGWINADRSALREASPRERASRLAETLQDWAAMMSGLTEIGQPGMAARVFTALNAELAPLTAESRARVYMELLPHTAGTQREEILNQVRDLLGADDVPMAARIQLNRILGTFSSNLFEIQGSMSALASVARYENPSPQQLVEIQEFRLALRNRLHDMVRTDPQRFTAGTDIHEIYTWLDQTAETGGGGSNGILDDLRAARQGLIDHLGSVTNPAERRRVIASLNDSFQEGMRMRLHGNDYGLQELLNQHLAMIRGLPSSERATVFSDSLQFLNQLEVERAHAAGRTTVSFRTPYFTTLTEALPSLVSDIPAGPERRSAILQFTRALSQARESEERRLRSAETELANIRATPAYAYAVGHGFGERYIGGREAEAVDALRPDVEAMRNLEVGLWNQFAEGETIPEARTVYAGFANAMRLTVQGHSAEARTAMMAYYSNPEVRAFLSADASGDAGRLQAQQQVQQLLDVSETILNGVAESRFDRTLRVVRGLARLRLHTLRAEGEEYPYDIGSIDRMTMELPRFLATLPPDRMPQTFEAALQLFSASGEGNARLVQEYNGAINRIPLQHAGSDGEARTGSVWGLIRAMEHVSEPGGAARAFAALQSVVVDDREWEWDSTEGRGDLGPALMDCCDILLEEGADMTPELRQSIATYRARIPEEEEEGRFLRENVNWTLAVDLGLMALSGGAGGIARAAFSRMVMGLAEEAALRMASSTAMRLTMMAGRGIAYVGGHVVSGITFNLVHSATSALVLNRPFENPFSSGLRMSADSIINDPLSMLLFNAIPGPSSMVGRFLYRTVATAVTFQVAQNIRYHGEVAARDLLGSSYHQALERREHARVMYDQTHDEYYQQELERAERDVVEIVGSEPDNSMRGIMHNIAMNLGQAGADHVMGTHHWAGNLGLEASAHGGETETEPMSEADRAARRDHHLSLAEALANSRDARRGTGREGGVYRAEPSEGPARAAAARVAGEERAFFRELVDLEVFDHYAPETVANIADLAAQQCDPHGTPPALNEAARRFLRFFFTHVNPEHVGRVGPEGLATIIQAVASRRSTPARAVEERPSRTGSPSPEPEAPSVATSDRWVPADRGLPEYQRPEEIHRDYVPDAIPDRPHEAIDETVFIVLQDAALADTMAHVDDLLRLADPAALRSPEGRARFLRDYQEAHRLLRDNPRSLGGLEAHEVVAALMARRSGEDLPTAARRLIAGELRLRAPTARDRRDAIPAATHPDSPLHRVLVEELTASHHETTFRELNRSIESTRAELSGIEARLRSRPADPQTSALRTALGEQRVRLEGLRRRLTELQTLIRSLHSSERELGRRGLAPERRTELEAEARRLRSQVASRLETVRNSGREIAQALLIARSFERMLPRPSETESGEREGTRVRVEGGERSTERSEGTPVGTRVRVDATESEGPELTIVDEETRVELSEDEARLLELDPVPAATIPAAVSATRTVNRMAPGFLAALGIGVGAATALAPATAHAQEAPAVAQASGGVFADVAAVLSTFGHSPAVVTGTLAVVAMGFGAYNFVRRAMARARATERSAAAVRESAATRNRAASSSRSEADGGGQGQSHRESSEETAQGTELPALLATPEDAVTTTGNETPVAPVTPVAPPTPEPAAAGPAPANERVLQNNLPGQPRRGSIERSQPTTEYGTASAQTSEGVGYKKSNEDGLVQGVDATGSHYAVVLDGVGGHSNGANASRLAGEVIQREMSQHGDLLGAFKAAHAAVRRDYPGAGACAVAHRVFRGADGRMRMEIVHVGDSGAVVFDRDGQRIYRSDDQSYVQMLADAHQIEGGEMAQRTHPDGNIVLGTLGLSQDMPPHRHEIVLKGGERAAMFTDGLGDNASTEEIGRILREGSSANAAQETLFGLGTGKMEILSNLLPVFESLAPGERVPFTAPDGRALYLAKDVVRSERQGMTLMMNVYNSAEGGELVDHYKPDNITVHVYFHNPLEATAVAPHTQEVVAPPAYVPTVPPAEGAPKPIDVPPPHLGAAAASPSVPPMSLLRPPARPGEPYDLHFPDLLGFQFLGTEAITGPVTIEDPAVAPRHAVIERLGPEQLLVQNVGDSQTFIVGADGQSLFPVPKYGWIIRSGDQVVVGGTRVRITASGRAPDQTEAGRAPHPFQVNQTFAPNFSTGSQEGFGARIHPERDRRGNPSGFSVESRPEGGTISVRSNPSDPNSPWRVLGSGERHPLRFERGVSEEFQNQDGMVFRLTVRGTIVHVRGGATAPEIDFPGPPPTDINLTGRDRFIIGSRAGADIPLQYDYSNPQALDPYLHTPSSNDPNLRYAPDTPADHAEVYRNPQGEWRMRNLSGVVIEITGLSGRSFFLQRGNEITLTEGQNIVFRGEHPYRYRFRIPAEAGAETAPPSVSLPRIRERVAAWLDAPTTEALNQRLAAEGVPFRVAAQEGPVSAESLMSALAGNPPTLPLTFENGRLNRQSAEMLFAFAALPESLRSSLRRTAQLFDGMMTDLTLRENPFALHYIRGAAEVFQNGLRECLSDLAQVTADFRPELQGEAQAILARLFFWTPENMAQNSNLRLSGVRESSDYWQLGDATPQEFPDPVQRAAVQARVEAAREDGRRAAAEAELIRARIQEHFLGLEVPATPGLDAARLRSLVAELLQNAQTEAVPEAAPASPPPPPAPPRAAAVNDPPRIGRARFRPISEIAAEAERVSGGLRRGEDPNSERVQNRVARYRDHLVEQGVAREEAERRAETWRNDVLGTARSHQARVTHIYDTSLPARPETAHLDAATVDHHGRFANERNATEQVLDRFNAALNSVRENPSLLEAARADRDAMTAALEGTGRTLATATPEDVQVAAAMRALNLREVTTDNLADGGWSVWIARNQARVLRDPQLRELIEAATHFEDFTAFGTTYSEATPGVRLQAALFQGYGEILSRHGVRGSDRFSPAQAVAVMGEAMQWIDGLLADPAQREAQAQEFFGRVEAARAIASDRGTIAEASVREGDTRLTFFDLRALSDFTVFQQWLALPRVTGPDGVPNSLQVSVAPMPPARRASGGEAPRTLQIVAIPHGRALPSGRGLLSVLDRVNAAERERARDLGVEPANTWFGKDSVILANPAGGGTLLRPEEISAILRDPALGLFEAPRAAPVRVEETAASRPEPAVSAPVPPPEATRQMDASRQRLATAAQNYRIRRSEAMTQALEALRAPDAAANPTLVERSEILATVFSDPRLHAVIELSEAMIPRRSEGHLAQDIFLAIFNGEISSVEEAVARVEGQIAPANERTRFFTSRPALERLLRNRAEDFVRRRLPFARDNEALRNFAADAMLARYGTELLRSPDLLANLESCRSLQERFNVLEANRPPQDPNTGEGSVRSPLEFSLDSVYSRLVARVIRPAERWGTPEESRAEDAQLRAELAGLETEIGAEEARRAVPATEEASMVELGDEDLVSIEEEASADLSDADVTMVDEGANVDLGDQDVTMVDPNDADVTILEEAPAPVDETVEILAQTPLPALFQELVEQRFEAPEERNARAETARQRMPRVLLALSEAYDTPIAPDSPRGQWILSRVLLHASRPRTEPSLPALMERVQRESAAYETVQSTGFPPNSPEGLRLANFLVNREIQQARELAAGNPVPHVGISRELLQGVDRLVLLHGDRSAETRERWIEWALRQEQGPELLADHFWETLAGVRQLRMGAEGPESVDRRGQGPASGLGESIAATLEELGIPAHSPEGLEVATLFLARSAVEALPGHRPFSTTHLHEALQAARELTTPLRELFAAHPELSRSGRAELTLWALRSGCSPRDITGMFSLFRRSPSETRPTATEVFTWILNTRPTVETLRRLRDGEYVLRRGPGIARLTTPEGRDVATGLESQLAGLREDFTRNFDSASEPADAGEPSEDFFDDWDQVGNQVREALGAAEGPVSNWPVLNDTLASRLGPRLSERLRSLLQNFRPLENQGSGPAVLNSDGNTPQRRSLEAYSRRASVDGPLGELAVELNEALGNDLQPGVLRRMIETLQSAPESSAEYLAATRQVSAILDLADRFTALRDSVVDQVSEYHHVYATLVSLFVAGQRQGARGPVVAVEGGLVVDSHEAPVLVDSEGRRADPDTPGAISQIGLIARRLQRGEPVDLDTVHVTLRGASDLPALLLTLRQLYPGIRAERGSVASEQVTFRYEPTPGTTLHIHVETLAAQRRSEAEAARREAGASTPGLRLVGSERTTGRRSARPQPPVESENIELARLAAALPEQSPVNPSSGSPSDILTRTDRRDAFEASLVELEDAGLIAAGTPLEDYYLPGTQVRDDGMMRMLHVMLRPNSSNIGKTPYRVVESANGVMRLEREAGHSGPDALREIRLATVRSRNPFRNGDRVFLLPGVHGASGDGGVPPSQGAEAALPAAPPALDPYTTLQLPEFAANTTQAAWSTFSRALQRKHLTPILTRSASSGFEFSSLAIEIDGRMLTTGENFLTSHSPRHVDGTDHLQLLEQAVSDLEFEPGISRDGTLRIYSFHTHPTRSTGSSFTRSPNSVHQDGRPFTLTNDADWNSYQSLFRAGVRELRRQGWRGPIEMVAGALPTGNSPEGPPLDPTLAQQPYVTVTRLRVEAETPPGTGPQSPSDEGGSPNSGGDGSAASRATPATAALGAEAQTRDAGTGPELAGRVASMPPPRFAEHPPVRPSRLGRVRVPPPPRLPDVERTDHRAFQVVDLINAADAVELHPVFTQLETIARGLETAEGGEAAQYATVAAWVRAQTAIVQDPQSPPQALEAAVQNLSRILEKRREFPEGNATLETFFRDRVLDIHRQATAPAVESREEAGTVRPPAPERGTVKPPPPGRRIETPPTETAPEPSRGTQPLRPQAPAPRVEAVPMAATSEPASGERQEAWREESEILAEIEQNAGRQLEGFSTAARNALAALHAHEAQMPDASDATAMQAWRRAQRQILQDYVVERDRFAREFVESHGAAGRQVLDFLRGLTTDDALWEEMEALGFERARIDAGHPPTGRPKNPQDVLPKIERRGWNSLAPFTDLFGTRVIVESYDDSLSVLAAIRHRFRVRPEFDRNGLPISDATRGARLDQERLHNVVSGRRSGYRALHVVVEVDGRPVEIQIQTRLLYRWGNIQHNFYKNEPLSRPENADLRQSTDAYFAEAASYLSNHEQGATGAERPRRPAFTEERLAALPEASRRQINEAITAMEMLLDSAPVATRSEPQSAPASPRTNGEPTSLDARRRSRGGERSREVSETEEIALAAVLPQEGIETQPSTLAEGRTVADATPAVSAPQASAAPESGENRPSDGGNALHSSFLGAGLMMAMTMTGHDSGPSLLAGILGTILPVGILGIFRWARNRGSANRTPPSGPAGGARSPAPARPNPEAGAAPRTAEVIPLEAAPPPVRAEAPQPGELPLLQPNIMGGNIPELDAHMHGNPLSPEAMAELLRARTRHARLPGGSISYLATQGIDPRHPVGEDFIGGVEHRDPHGRRVYSMMVADGMGGQDNGKAAATLSVEAFTAELQRSGNIRRAWDLANAVVRTFNRALSLNQGTDQAWRTARRQVVNPALVVSGEGNDGAGACAVSFSIVSPSRPGEPYVLQTHFAGDASVRVFRRGPDGRYRRVYSTVEENLGTLSVDARQEGGEDLHRTREISLHSQAHKVTNGIGVREQLRLHDTSGGELPQPNRRVRRAQGYENGMVLQDGDIVIGASDGFRENYIDTDEIGEFLRGNNSAEDTQTLAEETHARMEVVRLLNSGKLPAAANGRYRFTQHGQELYIDGHYNVFPSPDALSPIDKFKPDNFSLAVYRHGTTAEAARAAQPAPPPAPDPEALRETQPPRLPPPVPERAQVTPAPRRKPAVPPPIPEAARRPGTPAEDPVLAQARQSNLRLTGDVPGMTETLENSFLNGLRIRATRAPDFRYFAEFQGKRQEASVEQYQIYCRWRELMALGTGGVPAALQELSRQAMRPIAQMILNHPETVPVHRVQAGDFGFYLSRVIRVDDPGEQCHGYDFVLAVVPEVSEGVTTLKRRFFYRSHSGGSWRASPFLGLGGLMKGQFQIRGGADLRSTIHVEASRHYTAESEPMPQLLTALESLDRQARSGPENSSHGYVRMEGAEIEEFIGLASGFQSSEGDSQSSAIRQSLVEGYGERVSIAETPDLALLQELTSGQMFRGSGEESVAALLNGQNQGTGSPNQQDRVEARMERVRHLEYPAGFLPDFSQAELRNYRAEHTILGEVTYREFGGSSVRDARGRQRPLIWTLAEGGRRTDGSVRVWIQSIRFADAPASSYGVPAEILDSGGLTSKPIEYRNQAELIDGTRYAAEVPPSPTGESYPQYIDVTPALDALRPIREYRAARGLSAEPVSSAAPPPALRSMRRPIVVADAPAAPAQVAPAQRGNRGAPTRDRSLQLIRRGRSVVDRNFVYQMRIEATREGGPRLIEVSSPEDLSANQIKQILQGHPQEGVTVREGWSIVNMVGEGDAAGTIVDHALPLDELTNSPNSGSVQLNFYFLPSEETPIEGDSSTPRAVVVDPTLRGTSGREPAFLITGTSETHSASDRVWLLQAPQNRVVVSVNGGKVLPFEGFVRLREGDRIRVGLQEFQLRGQSLATTTSMQLRLSIPPAQPGVEVVPLAAALEDPAPPERPGPAGRPPR